MQIHVQAPQLQDPRSFREAACARTRFVLRRAAQEVLQARVQVRDLNGPRGGVDQQCRVTLVTRSRGVLVVTSRARHAGEALAHALRMAVRALVKVWQRQRQPDRKTLRAEPGSSSPGVAIEGPPEAVHDAGLGEARG